MNKHDDPRTDAAWAELDRYLDELLALEPEQREARLAGMETTQATKLRQLLAAAADAHGFDQSMATAWLHLAGHAPTQPGTCVGPWRIVRQIGSGGMAQVFLAERADGSYQQQVALKLLWPGMARPDLLARFERERQILAALDDPRIARLIDGGVGEDGRPWLAMELIDGLPVHRYCDTHRLGLRKRLELFVQIASAVSAAHRQLVVHRDLKPANVLVTRAGEVRLLDFGVARLLDDGNDPDAEPLTRPGQPALTPEYASPEQLTGARVTTATDVYQLGALLFQLLTSVPPRSCRGVAATRLADAVLHVPPPLPATHLREMPPDVLERVAAARDTTPRHLRRALRGDLDAICSKAMAFDTAERYPSADALAQDVQRLLQGRPVLARRPGRLYHARKFLGRHRLGAAAAALLAISVIAGVAGVGWQARVAQSEARKAEEVRAFLVSLFEVNAPDAAQGREVRARELLDAGARRIRTELSGQPAVQAELMLTLGDVYRRLSLYEQAGELLELALAIQQRLRPAGHPDVAAVRVALGNLYFARGYLDEAEAQLQQALASQRRALGPDHLAIADTLHGLIEVHRRQGRQADAEGLAHEMLRILREHHAEDDLRVISGLRGLAVLLHNRDELDQAERLYLSGLHALRSRFGDSHTEIASTLHNLAVLSGNRGDFQTAQALFQESLDIKRSLFGDRHTSLVQTLAGLGGTMQRHGDLDGAESAYREAVAILRESGLAPNHPSLAGGLFALGSLLAERGQAEEAQALLAECLEIRQVAFGPDHPRTGEARERLLAVAGQSAPPISRADP